MGKRGFGVRSSRGGFFKEPSHRSPEKRRLQKVRFRRAYASSVMKRTWMNLVKTVAGGAIVASLVYGGISAWRFWQTSSSMRVSVVEFAGDIPPALASSFSIKPGAHLFRLDLKKMETDLKQLYPEMEKLSISRGLDRSITVSGRYKKAEALLASDGKTMGVISDGTVFPVRDYNPQDENLVILAGKSSAAARKEKIEELKTWKKGSPEFSSLVKRVETDNIGTVRVILEGGIVVEWGEMVDSELLIDAGNILNVLDRFTPARIPATLRVLSKNRIVMDSNWKQK